ncbi:MAG: response regulator [Methylococcaceae bacterium]|nr:response regulator [Methylococcaceae bacterium]
MALVLVVDDNATNLTLFRHLLKKMNDVEVVCFDDPLRAIEWCVDKTPDLVLLDYMMPDMDGLEFIMHFRAIPGYADIPLIMVTADTETDVRYRALEQGAHDFLTKPVDKTELTARVRNLLALRRSQVQLANRSQWLAQEVKKATAEIAAREKEVIFRLSKAAEYRDPETGAHLLRMANYSRIIAAKMGLSEEEQELLLEAAPMHDIGKVGTPDHILLKPGKLTEEEFEIMKLHAINGYNILADSESPLLRLAADLALTHHEKFNGSGYPRGLAGEQIPLEGRIVAVADVFDALTSERPYKHAWPLQQAVEFLQVGRGIHFDPACVDAFLAEWSKVLAVREQYQDETEEITPDFEHTDA